MAVYGKYEVTFANANSTWARAGAMVAPGSRVLDVGCSAGQLAEALAATRGCVVDGVEIDPQDAATAARRCRRVWTGDLIQLAERIEGPYDHVVMLDVLEHMPDPGRALEVAARLLAPGGSLVLSVPNMAHAAVRLQLLQGHFPAEDEGLLDRTHLRFFDEVTLLELIAASPLSLHSLDRITLDLDPELVQAALRAVGLEATPAFTDLISSREACTYQFVARLVPREGSEEPPPVRQEYVAPLTQYWDSVRALQARVASLEAQLAERRPWSQRLRRSLRPLRRALKKVVRP